LRKTDTIQAQDLVSRHMRPDRPLLTILHGIQAEAGYLPADVIAPLARALNLSRAEVHGFITYYPHFRTAPPAPIAIQLCRAEACQSMGSEALAQHIEQRTGCRFADHAQVAPHADEPGPGLSLESVYCLGLCALSPALTLNQRLHAKVTPLKFDGLLAAAQHAEVEAISLAEVALQVKARANPPEKPAAAKGVV
jgi:formate dehydrogenase subunit gamma